MDVVVYLALAVLAAVFLFSLFVLLLLCYRRNECKRLLTTQSLRFSKLRLEHDRLDNVLQLGPHLSQVLSDNKWVDEVSGMLADCLSVLKLCHLLTEKLSHVPLQQISPQMNELICTATGRVVPRFDGLLRSMAAKHVDIRVIEARVESLVIACWSLAAPFYLINPKYSEVLSPLIVQMETHHAHLQLALEQAEREKGESPLELGEAPNGPLSRANHGDDDSGGEDDGTPLSTAGRPSLFRTEDSHYQATASSTPNGTLLPGKISTAEASSRRRTDGVDHSGEAKQVLLTAIMDTTEIGTAIEPARRVDESHQSRAQANTAGYSGKSEFELTLYSPPSGNSDNTAMVYLQEQIVSAFEKFPAENIRNVSILAHVDHGKTSLADHLIADNGIISARLAGQLKFMDSREDEQERGITMKSSAIVLLYEPLLITLVDSPGHVDFCSEVDFAIQITDIALLVVDVVEGVCSQTEVLLRQAINNRLELILVLSKLDRLVLELKLSEAEAFQHLMRLMEQLNSCISKTLQGQLANAEGWHAFDAAESSLHFNPSQSNRVIFTSALYGYGFSLGDFASIWKKRLPELKQNEEELCRNMFAFDKYLDPKTMTIASGAEQKRRKPLFQQLVLEPLWEVHKCGLIEKDLAKLKQLAAKLSLPQLKAKRLDQAVLEFMRLWLPLTSAVVKACARARRASQAFVTTEKLTELESDPADSSKYSSLVEALRTCNAESDCCILQVARLMKTEDRRLALVRVLCGTLREQMLFHPPAELGATKKEIQIHRLFIPMGRDLIPLERASSGRICLIEVMSDEEWYQMKGQHRQGTLYSKSVPDEISMHPLELGYNTAPVEEDVPLVQVTLQPVMAGSDEKWNALRKALRTLSHMDKSIRVLEKESGDLVLVTAGEVHLQKCLKDLADAGQSDIVVSQPIVPFMETIVIEDQQGQNVQNVIKSQLQTCHLTAGPSKMEIKLRAVPLSMGMVELLHQEETLIGKLRIEGHKRPSLEDATKLVHAKFRDKLLAIAKQELPTMRGTWWWKKPEAKIEELISRIWCFGPANSRTTLLLNDIPDYERPSIWEDNPGKEKSYRPFDRAAVSGFDLAMLQGPLCDEPMRGVAIVVEEWSYCDNEREQESTPIFEPQLYGQMISAFKQGCYKALKVHPLRLVAAMYQCTVQTPTQALGKVQNVLAQKRAKVVSEDVNEMNGLIELNAHLPVVESFSFCDFLRKRSSGLAAAQLRFSHWQVIELDPFWEPSTEEEKEEFGQMKVTSHNQARLYVDAVRRRKGLPTDELIVQSAEKQRTLKKNK